MGGVMLYRELSSSFPKEAGTEHGFLRCES